MLVAASKKKGTAMEYRNIDNDLKLYKFAKRYHEEKDITIDQMKWVLSSDGYSEKEVNRAIEDYFLIHVRTDKIVNSYILPFCALILILVLILKLIYKL